MWIDTLKQYEEQTNSNASGDEEDENNLTFHQIVSSLKKHIMKKNPLEIELKM